MLAKIRERQRKPAAREASELQTVRGYIDARARGPIPRDAWDPLERFRERALSLASTVDSAGALSEVPGRVAHYLREHGLPLRAVCWPALAALDWAASGIHVEARTARGDDLVGVTGAFCAIAETGTLVTLSGPASPPTASLLPETHVAVLDPRRIVPTMEDAWTLIRAEHGTLPRAVNFISGPSRTADIEQTLTFGAHGPYRVHVVLAAG